jgi:DNA-binding response OmpR family regulator
METIMIQEADEATLEVITAALQMAGYRGRSLTDDNENMLDMIRHHHPKLILLDCWLSNYSGKQVCHWIKSHFPRLPVIAFSCDNHIGEKYRALGFDDYISKPFDLELLYRVIRKHLRAQPERRGTAEPVF